MKKSALLKSAVLALVMGLAFATNVNDSYSNGYANMGSSYVQYDFLGQQIATSSYLELMYDDIGAFANMGALVVTASNGCTITTANVGWLLYDGSVLTSNTMTIGTNLTNFYSGRARVRIYSNLASPTNVTMNVMVRK